MTDHALLNARYDNADVAYAIGITNFPEWRKNLERQTEMMPLPRIDENSARPKFRLGHIYQYALIDELTKYMSREGAISATVKFFRNMWHGSTQRYNDLDDQSRAAIASDGLHDRYVNESSVKAPADFYRFVEYPAIAFDPRVLDRSDERQAAPLFWVMAPKSLGLDKLSPLVLGPTVNLVETMSAMTDKARSINFDPYMVEEIRSVIVIDLTGLLSAVDQRLALRLRARELRGGE